MSGSYGIYTRIAGSFVCGYSNAGYTYDMVSLAVKASGNGGAGMKMGDAI